MSFAEIDLRELAEMSGPDRAFLSVYLSTPDAARSLSGRFERLRRALRTESTDRSEREHFEENVRLVENHLARHPLKSGSLCLFACWALDFFRAIPLNVPVQDRVWIDSSPYIRPLAELQEEYENVAVVVVDNKKARIFMVASATAGEAEQIRGNVKNHVRKGGWSQQRYERRRDKQLLLYAREIVNALQRLSQDESFRRIILVGGKEIIDIIRDNLPKALAAMAADKALDLHKGGDAVHRDIMELFFEQERRSEVDLWERIRDEYLRGGLAAAGLTDVVEAARQGRAETVIVDREFKSEGVRCVECSRFEPTPATQCPACSSDKLFPVDSINELVEMLKLTGADIEFTDPIPTLSEVGHVAALLRY